MPENGERDHSFRFQCKQCNFGGRSPLAIVQHEYHHKNPGLDQDLIYCIVCDQSFLKENELHVHQKEVHRGLVYSCQFCTRKFRKDHYSEFLQHVQQKHTIESGSLERESHTCAHCGHPNDVK